jgi:hypothetical protein
MNHEKREEKRLPYLIENVLCNDGVKCFCVWIITIGRDRMNESDQIL